MEIKLYQIRDQRFRRKEIATRIDEKLSRGHKNLKRLTKAQKLTKIKHNKNRFEEGNQKL